MELRLAAVFLLTVFFSLHVEGSYEEPFELLVDESHEEPHEPPEIKLHSNLSVRCKYLYAQDGNKYYGCLGLPYAEETQRFKDPNLKDYSKLNGTINGTVEPPKCVQINEASQEAEGSEDCLYLSIFAPVKCLKEKLGCGVYIWYHGGGYQSGPEGSLELIFQYLMKKNVGVVVVFAQYRLNVFGFMRMNDKHIRGNMGMEDICMVPVWVNKNIKPFGGNSARVTSLGESAGGNAAYLAMEVCDPKLVHKTFSNSGSIFILYPANKDPVERASKLCAERVGCHGTDHEVFECLKEVDAYYMIKECNVDSITYDNFTSVLKYIPVLNVQPIGDLKKQGLRSYRPLVAGVCKDEWILTIYIEMCKHVVPLMRKDLQSSLYYLLGKIESELSHEEKTKAIPRLIDFYFKFDVAKASDEHLCTVFAKVMADATIYFPFVLTACLYKGPKWNYFVEYSTDLNKLFAKSLNITDQKNPVPHACLVELWGYYRNLYSPYASANASTLDESVIKRVLTSIGRYSNVTDPTGNGLEFAWRPNCKKFELNQVNGVIDGPAPKSTVQWLTKVYKLWKSILSGHIPHCV